MTNELGLIISLAPWFFQIFKKYKLKKELKDIISPYLKDLDVSYANFLKAFYLFNGALGASLYLKPKIQSNQIAKDIIENLKDNYNAIVNDIEKILEEIDTHRDEFKQVFKLKDWLLIEEALKANESGKLNLNRIVSSPSFIKALRTEIKSDDRFMRALGKEFNNFSEESGIKTVHNQSDENRKLTIRLFSKLLTGDPVTVLKKLKDFEQHLK